MRPLFTMRYAIGIALALVYSTLNATAQQHQSPEIQALSMRVSSEISANLQCTASVIALKAELQAVQDRVKILEAQQNSQDAQGPTK